MIISKKRKLQNILFIIILQLILGTQMLFHPIPTYASQPLNIVVIGDSIAKGIGSSDVTTKNYGACLADKLQGNLTNLGISGLDSNQLLAKLETDKFKNALTKADVILISIGSNDLLKPFLSIVSDTVGADTKNTEVYQAIQSRMAELSKNNIFIAANTLSNVVRALNNNPTLNEACEKFPDNFKKLIGKLKKDYPDAIIYVDNVYNPYYGVAYELNGISILNIYQLCEEYILKLNQAFQQTTNDYALMDMYSIFKQEGYTNVNKASIKDMSKASFDPHPNDAGYQMMADYIYTQMDSISPTAKLANVQDVFAVTQNQVVIQFNEEVRAVKDMQIFLKNGNSEFTYTFKQNTWTTADGEGNFNISIPLSDWVGGEPSEKLQYATNYEVYTQPGTFKDKGNNSLKNENIGAFRTENNPQEATIETMGNAKKATNITFKIIIISLAGAFILISMIIIIKKKITS